MRSHCDNISTSKVRTKLYRFNFGVWNRLGTDWKLIYAFYFERCNRNFGLMSASFLSNFGAGELQQCEHTLTVVQSLTAERGLQCVDNTCHKSASSLAHVSGNMSIMLNPVSVLLPSCAKHCKSVSC